MEPFEVVTVRWGGAFLIAILLFAAIACSSSTHSNPVKCNPASCAAGSACVGGSDAGATCQKLCTRQNDCPFNWYCNDGQPKSWCALSTINFSKQSGQFGDPCLPSGGENNSACDTLDTCGCYGTSPTDANAFCTLFDCAQDSDCQGGWWCATVDASPNVSTTARSFGKPPRNVCLPRKYCANCTSDHDCYVPPNETPDGGVGPELQHCVPDSAGGSYCSSSCGSDANCPLDAVCRAPWAVCAPRGCAKDGDCQKFAPNEVCVGGACQVPCIASADCPASNGAPQHCSDAGTCVPQSCTSDDDCPPAAGTFQHCKGGGCTPECGSDGDCNPDVGDQACTKPLKVCMPRAGICVGDGSFCSPCRADADCSNGYCIAAGYSTERFCSQTMQPGTSCSSTGPTSGACPTRANSANYKAVACTSSASDTAPANQCIGVVTFGMSSTGRPQIVPGCWTVNR
jgi:hypothetical protein